MDAGDAAASLLDVSRGANAARSATSNAVVKAAPTTSSRAPLPARVPAALPSAPKDLDFLKQRTKGAPSTAPGGTSARNKAQAHAVGVGAATRKEGELSKLKKPSSSSPPAAASQAAPSRSNEPAVREASKPKPPSAKGAVLFNGVEVGGDASTDEDWSRKSVRAKAKATQHGDDEWDVV